MRSFHARTEGCTNLRGEVPAESGRLHSPLSLTALSTSFANSSRLPTFRLNLKS